MWNFEQVGSGEIFSIAEEEPVVRGRGRGGRGGGGDLGGGGQHEGGGGQHGGGGGQRGGGGGQRHKEETEVLLSPR